MSAESSILTFGGVEREDAIRRIPETYATALGLADEGLTEAEMADRLGIPRESVAPLLRIAEAKLARLVATVEDSPRVPVSSEEAPGGTQ